MKKITVLSGKGGVGKSSIAASLALMLAKQNRIVCADCDVDASNLALVFGAEKQERWDDLSTNEKAVFDLDKCGGCKSCLKECYFDAIEMKHGKPFLKPFSCEGCGVCEIVCKRKAVCMEKINNAKIGYAKTRYGFNVVSAQLNIGESGSGKVVAEVRKLAEEIGKDSEIMIIDAAAGKGCPVIASVTGSDYAVLVTEPTPSGFSDMKRALEVVQHFNIKAGIIINKADINKEHCHSIESFGKSNNIRILAKIPFDRDFAKALTELTPIVEYKKSYAGLFNRIKETIVGEL